MRLSALVTMAMVFVSPFSVQRGDGQARVEVASIKAVKGPDDPRGLSCALPSVERTGGRIWVPFGQVCGLMRVAYDLADYQVVGIPRDTGVGPSNFFEVEVRLAGGNAPSREETRGVLRELLAERFKLRAHPESRDMLIYALVTTTNGPRLTPCPNPKAASGYVHGRIVSCDPPLPMPRLLQFLSAKQVDPFSTRPVCQRRRSSFAGCANALSQPEPGFAARAVYRHSRAAWTQARTSTGCRRDRDDRRCRSAKSELGGGLAFGFDSRAIYGTSMRWVRPIASRAGALRARDGRPNGACGCPRSR